MTRRIVSLLVVAVAAVALIACDSDDDAEDPMPEATTAPVEATPDAEASDDAAGDDDGAVSEDPAPGSVEYPLTVRDLMGREVTLDAQPERIITTSPSAIELLYEAGGTATGRSSTALGVPGAEDLVDVGPSYEPAFEVILQEDPDLVVADVSAQAHLADAFEGALQGVPVLFVGAVEYGDISTSIRLLGDVIGEPDAAAAAADDVDAVADEVAADVGSNDRLPALALVAGRDGGMSAALDDSFIGDLLRIAGAENVAADVPQSGQQPGYAQVSLETVVADDPEVILVIVPGEMGGPSVGDMIAQQFPDLSAAANDRIHEIDLETYLQAPGPRAVDGLRELAGLLHPAE